MIPIVAIMDIVTIAAVIVVNLVCFIAMLPQNHKLSNLTFTGKIMGLL
jgi:hypothetical protein